MQRCSPVKHFYSGRDGNEKTEQGESESGIDRLAGDEHVVSPNQETENCDGYAGISDEVVAEDFLPRKAGDRFADHSHPRKNHDIDGGMRIEPEEMLKKDRVAAEFWIEESEAPDSFESHQGERNREDGGREDKNDAG